MKAILFKSFAELTGQPFSSRLLKRFTSSKCSRPLIQPFISFYGINTAEAEFPPAHYSSLNEYFTRSLKPGSRIAEDGLVSPVDGVLSASGEVTDGQQFTVKGKPYSLQALFGSEERAKPYENGWYFLFYLSPQHYHHVHYPLSGTLINRYALGNTSYPVNDLGIRFKDELFSSNYRIISEIESGNSRAAVVKVGALNVNSIRINDSSKICEKGQDFAHFAFGSTVILFIENKDGFISGNLPFTDVHAGAKIGEWKS